METSTPAANTATTPDTARSAPEIPYQGRGKIASLERGIREELNERLENGQQAAQILPWLNGLPRVQETLHLFFNDVPISPQNLSAWRRGGFQFWLWQHELLQNSHLMRESVENMQESLQYDCSRERPGLLVDDLLSQFTAQVASFMLHSSGAPNDQQWPAFMKVGNFLIKLQNACHRAERPERLRKAEEDEESRVRAEIREEMRQEEQEQAMAKNEEAAEAKKARKKTRSSSVKANQGSDPQPAKPAIVKNVDFAKETPPADSASTV